MFNYKRPLAIPVDADPVDLLVPYPRQEPKAIEEEDMDDDSMDDEETEYYVEPASSEYWNAQVLGLLQESAVRDQASRCLTALLNGASVLIRAKADDIDLTALDAIKYLSECTGLTDADGDRPH